MTALVSAAAWQRAPSPTWRTEAAEHDAILRTAEAGDGAAASTLLRAHIESFLTRNFPSLRGSRNSRNSRDGRDSRDGGDTDAP
jgi:DNA-binding GntR family transcriptional regulator